MRTRWIGVIGAVLLLTTLGLGTAQAGFMPAGFGSMMGPGMMGPGMMGGGFFARQNGKPLEIADAQAAVAAYLRSRGGNDLVLGEIMIFDNHAYAQVLEKETGIGAFEVLVDPVTRAVMPEPGPNMMWNIKYSPMGGASGMGMMGGRRIQAPAGIIGGTAQAKATMPVTPDEAIQRAQRYLDTYQPGNQAEQVANAFYGYYTIHYERDGKLVGMLSVNGSTSQVFPHTWHGAFITMSDEEH